MIQLQVIQSDTSSSSSAYILVLGELQGQCDSCPFTIYAVCARGEKSVLPQPERSGAVHEEAGSGSFLCVGVSVPPTGEGVSR